ncbi:hypothetical protein BGZ97_005969 [Linnemannia gamsii]|jgi:hypothetical protein|uniref:Uncharacterized protein n=1 Tax=Linnemannia gamsii TaxID=64522 RepID=A0A9P6RE79_9FUNG|nr:hypothetical protein BGZ97_005969 [Linnemannia gamsii]
MILTKLHLFACLFLCCLAWNAEACTKITGWGKLTTVWSIYLPKPITRRMEFHLQINGQTCRLAKDFGGGDYMTKWRAESDDGRCTVSANTKSNSLNIGVTGGDGSGAALGGTFYPEDMSEQPSGSYISIQNLMYGGINFSNC